MAVLLPCTPTPSSLRVGPKTVYIYSGKRAAAGSYSTFVSLLVPSYTRHDSPWTCSGPDMPCVSRLRVLPGCTL